MSCYTIGSESIYPEQIKAGDEIVKLYKSNKYSPLLVAEMQQGKTGVVCYVIDKLMRECEEQGFTFKFYVCINISDNDLKNQTEKRIRKANFSPDDVIVLHRNEYKNHPTDESIDRTFIIIDECHYALGASGEISEDSEAEDKAEFEGFLHRCGIDYGSPESNWGKPGFWILSVSATPFCHAVVKLRDSKNDKGFQIVRLERDTEYYGLKEMKNNNRLFQSEQLMEGKEISNWFKERVEEYLLSAQVSDNKYGHLVLRTNGKSKAAIKKYLQEKYQNKIDVQEFSSSNKKDGRISPISKVGETISSYRRKPSIVIISGALRAGKTLDRTENIKMWIEPPTSLPDAMLQAVGRVMGRGKINDKFPIFCNLKSVDDSIQFFDDPAGYVVPEGLNNKPTKKETVRPIWGIANFNKTDLYDKKRVLYWSGIGTKTKDRQYNVIEKWKTRGMPWQEGAKRGGFDYLILDSPMGYESPLREECLNSLKELKKEYPEINFDDSENPPVLYRTDQKHNEIIFQTDQSFKRATVLD